MDNRSLPINVEQLFAAPVATVWKIITEPDHMKQWFFNNIPDFKPEVGFHTSFPVVSNGRTFTHKWTITSVAKESQIVYSWGYAEYQGQGHVSFTLIPQGNQCMLVLSNIGLDSFPADIPEFSRAGCEGGWIYFIKGQLKNYVDKHQLNSAN